MKKGPNLVQKTISKKIPEKCGLQNCFSCTVLFLESRAFSEIQCYDSFISNHSVQNSTLSNILTVELF